MVRSLSRKGSSLFGQPRSSVDDIPPIPQNVLLARLRDIQIMEQHDLQPHNCARDPLCGTNGGVCQYPSAVPSDLYPHRHAPMSPPPLPAHVRNQQSCSDSIRIRHDQLRAAQQAIDTEISKTNAESYAEPFCDFMTTNPTAYHAVEALKAELDQAGYKELSERNHWDVQVGGKYYVSRNGTSLIAFALGAKYKSGNGAAIAAGHIDQLCFKIKGVSKLPPKAGYEQIAVAGYARPGMVWWDRDLGIAGRVLVKENGKVRTKLVKLNRPIARIPSLAPHFGQIASPPFNPETQEVPIIGLECTSTETMLGSEGSYAARHPPRLVKAVSQELGISDYDDIVSWDLELFDITPAVRGGLDNEFIYACRLDDKLCSWAALQALKNSSSAGESHDQSSIIKVTALFDNEEIGSLTRQGARSNFLKSSFERIIASTSSDKECQAALLNQVFANSFIVSSDVTHAINPNFLNAYDEKNSPRLNVGMAIDMEANLTMTTDAVSEAIFQECANRVGHTLQPSQKRNDTRGGGTIGPYLVSLTGARGLDAGIAQLSMHSARAQCGALDPGLGTEMYQALFDNYEEVDKMFS